MSTEAAKPTGSHDALFVNAFLAGTVQTFKIQCSYEITPEKPRLLKPEEMLPMDICGVIGLTSNVFRGAITLCFPEPLFLAVMGSMFGETFTSINAELSDGVGELLNILFGQAKTTLTNEGFSVDKAIPTVVRGKDIKVSSLTGGGPTIVVPFNAKDGKLHVLVSLGHHGAAPKLVPKKA